MVSNINVFHFIPTFSLRESVEEAAPISRVWLKLIHAIKVEKRDRIVLCIAGHVNYLQEKTSVHRSFLYYTSNPNNKKRNTLQFCSQKDFGTNWTG